MLRLIPFLLFLSLSLHFTNPFFAQKPFEGKWGGTLKIKTLELGLVFNIEAKGEGYVASMYSPDQGAIGIPVPEVSQHLDSIILKIPNIGLQYKGKQVSATTIEGIFKQYETSYPLTLQKGEGKILSRPQEPKPKFNYKVENISIPNKMAPGVTLEGTLTIPHGKGPFPAIVLVSGSGPQDRDETILGHKPFWVLADYFTNNGHAVFRYDDRGVGASKGDFETSTTDDFASDALAVVQFLQTRKDIQKKKVGIMGHSEGGIIAAQLAAHQKEIGFIVMLAGSGVGGDEVLLQQQEKIARTAGTPDSMITKSLAANKAIFEIIKSTKDTVRLRERVLRYLNHAYRDGTLPADISQTKEQVVSFYTDELLSPWLIHFIQYNPQTDLQKITIPTLALIGTKDLQVLPEFNIPALKTALAKNKKATVLELSGLNHLFQEATTGLPQEYATIEQTFSPDAMKIILDWIQQNAK